MQPLPPEVHELLCIRLDTMGDVLMTGPALRALRGAAPDRRVTLLTSEPGAGVAALMPEVDDTIVYEAPWLKRERTSDPDGDRQMIAALRERAFDAAVIFTVYTQSPLPAALLCHLAGVPLRGAHCRENPYGLLSHWVAEREPNHTVRHEVRRQLDLAAALGARARDERLAVALPEEARARAGDALKNAGVDRDAPWAVVHPGATAASRRYPEDLWALACRALADEHDVRLVFTGDSAEVAVAERVRQLAGDPGPSLAGRLSLAELAALLEAAPLLLAGNTGPVHLAAAVSTPVVDVYALTNPQHAPWMVPSRVLYQDVPCRWCYSSVCREGHHRCLLDVTPEQIVTAALDLLAGRPQPEVVLPPVPAGWEARPPRDIGKEAAWRG